MSEAPTFASTNPQYDNRLFIESQVQYMKIPSSNLGRTCCVQKLFLTLRTISVHNMFSPCSELAIFMYWARNSMNNLLSYCGLVDTKIRASDKDLPLKNSTKSITKRGNQTKSNFSTLWFAIFQMFEPKNLFWTKLGTYYSSHVLTNPESIICSTFFDDKTYGNFLSI